MADPTPVTVAGTAGPVELPLRALSRGEWARLLDEHPPTSGAGRWGPGFLPALLTASYAPGPGQPALTGEAAVAVLDDTDTGPDVEAALLGLSQPPPVDALIRRLRSDSRLRAESAYCLAAGVTREAFLAQSDYDQDLAVAVMEDRAHRCPGCGVPDEDMANRDAGWESRARQCVWCEVNHRATKAIPDEHRHAAHLDLIHDDGGGT